MSPPGRPKGEYRSAQHEGTPVSLAPASLPGPMISVITVCFNSAPVLPRAIASLAAQTWPNREWVVVDGGSSDGTQALVQAAGPTTFVSERDKGIYDAMNKAVALARGEVLYFLNSDDGLHDPEVLHDVAAQFAADPALSFLMGRVVVEKPGRQVLTTQRYINRLTLPYWDPCHQGVFARRSLFDELGGFDLRWKTSADYDWFLRVRRAGHRLQHFERTVAFFHAGGAHAADPAGLIAERRAIRLQYLSPWALDAGSFLARGVHRLSKQLRGGLALGESLVPGA